MGGGAVGVAALCLVGLPPRRSASSRERGSHTCESGMERPVVRSLIMIWSSDGSSFGGRADSGPGEDALEDTEAEEVVWGMAVWALAGLPLSEEGAERCEGAGGRAGGARGGACGAAERDAAESEDGSTGAEREVVETVGARAALLVLPRGLRVAAASEREARELAAERAGEAGSGAAAAASPTLLARCLRRGGAWGTGVPFSAAAAVAEVSASCGGRARVGTTEERDGSPTGREGGALTAEIEPEDIVVVAAVVAAVAAVVVVAVSVVVVVSVVVAVAVAAVVVAEADTGSEAGRRGGSWWGDGGGPSAGEKEEEKTEEVGWEEAGLMLSSEDPECAATTKAGVFSPSAS